MKKPKAMKNTQTWAGYSNRTGIHTWDLSVEYHKCTSCSKIFESRQDYRYALNKWVKTIECPFCGTKEEVNQSLWRRQREREHG